MSGDLALTRADLEQTIPARFAWVVRQVPERVALRGEGRSWTYAALNAAANRIAHAIRERGGAGGRVVYLADPSPEMVLATLAILKAGATYVAIHPRTPAAAQREILLDVAPALLLATEARAGDARAIAAGICEVLVLESAGAEFSEDDPAPVATARDASTLFYTSGSTGRPKGVVKSHRAVLHRVWLSAQYDRVGVEDRQSLLTHCSFSASESDMFGALLQGAAVCTFDIASQGFAEFRAWLETERITLLHPPVLFFRRFLGTLEPAARFPAVRIVALAGDVVLPSDLRAWWEHASPACVVLHRFSITEAAMLTVASFDREADLSGHVLEAGRPVPDKTLRLDDQGELSVQSDYLADGYWNRPEETAAAFTVAADGSGERVYRTGDLGRFAEDGTFSFLGRRDDQVKIRGFRVELREIDAALMQLEGVREAACVAARDGAEPRLQAFVVWQEGRAVSAAELRTRLKELLPEWKVPEQFHAVSALPTTLTGKVDRRALLESVADRGPVPSDPQTLLGVWSRVLKRRVALDDAFFEDLGGSSLDALEIVNDVSRLTGRRLPPSLLLELNTVRKLSGYLDASPDRERIVIALNGDGSLPPLFCVSGKGGSVIRFRALAEALGGEQPFYGLTHHALHPLPTTLAAFAAIYADAIRAQQPEGPYYLAGYSAGGLVAFEVARQLARAGHRIAFLGLLDTAAGGARVPRWKSYRKYGSILRRDPAAFLPRLARGLARRASNAARWASTGQWPARPVLEENLFYDSLQLQSSVQPWPASPTLFLARQGTGAHAARRDAGWAALCGGGLAIVEIDGEHDTILTRDVRGLARALSRALAAAR